MTRRTWMITSLCLLVAPATIVGCNRLVGETLVPEQRAIVGCGLCRFRIPESRSCYWAIELDGQHYPVVGANQPDHDSHGPEGMCVMERTAIVEGKLKRGQFIASRFELLPAEGVDSSAAPVPHEH